VIGNS
jgi:hypothetical protein